MANSIRVRSDGTPSGTEVTDSAGNKIENITEISITCEPKEPVRVIIDMMLPMLDINGMLESIQIHCPACKLDFEHICKRDGGGS